MRRLGRDAYHYALDPSLPPGLEVDQGESFWVETQDAHRGTITGEDVVYASLEDTVARLGGANPVTGPVAVRGAEPGDCLLVAIEEIVPAPRRRQGYTCTTARVDPRLGAETVICPVVDGELALPTAAGEIALPLRPMVGTLAVAPARGRRPSFEQARDVLGNVDLPAMTAGATVVLQAHAPGGLLFVGDAHLAQGDAEIHRAAIEVEADVRLSIRRAAPEDAGFVGLPQLNANGFVGSIAPGPGPLDDLVRDAYADLAARLVRSHGLALGDAYRLLGAAGRVTVGQVVPPLASVLAWLPTELLRFRR